jgi:translocation and assembly module TamB
MLRRLILAVTLILWPLAVPAQDDKGYLVTLLEENLSGAGRSVTIDGFSGALSSRAAIQRLTVADDQGIWLTLNGISLDWSRSALLAGEVSVNELTADEIIVARKPITADTPTPEAGGFSLPELPVSITIGKLAAGRITLGPDILGEDFAATLSASVVLARGEGLVDARLTRIDDGPAAEISLKGSYTNAERRLVLDLSASEGQGGIAARMIGIPGTPATDLTITGAGPIDDFTAQLRLATDGQDRLTGTVAVKADSFAVDVSGDVAPLFLPDYAEFFGPSVVLKATGQQTPTGGVSLSNLDLSARSLSLQGAVDLAPDGLPTRMDVTGQIAAPDGSRVLLPTPDRIEIDRANLTLAFDSTVDDGWRGAITLIGLDRDDFDADRLALTGSGRIARPAGLATFTAALDFAANGLRPADPALAQALGSDVTGDALLSAQEGTDALRLPRVALRGDGFSLNGAAEVAGLSDAFRLSGRAEAQVADLSRLSALTGQTLGGAAALSLSGNGSLGGDFDLQTTLTGQDLWVGQAQADRLLAGTSRVSLDAKRDTTGTTLRALNVAAGPLTASAKGTLTSAGNDLTARLDLTDLGRLDPTWRGAISADVTVTGPTEAARITLDGQTRALALGQPEADKLLAGVSDLSLVLRLAEGALQLDSAKLRNPQLTLDAKGSASATKRDLTLQARLANLGLFVPDFPGAVTIDGTASDAGRGYDLSLAAQGPGGIDATVKGNLSQTFDRADLSVKGRALAALANPFLSGRLISGPLSFDLALKGPLALSSLSGTVGLNGGRIADPALAMALQDVNATARLNGASATVTADAALSTKGRLAVTGTVGLAAPFTAGLDITVQNALLRDPQLFETTANGTLRLQGPLTGGASIAGQITLSGTEVQIPSTSLGGAADLPGLTHLNEPAAVRDTRARAGLLGQEQTPTTSAAPFALNITVSAPNRLFIRGRGLDAELGGALTLRGTTAAVVPNGAFSLLRGRLDILGRRLTLTEAQMAMEGNLIPTVAIAASTESDGVTSTIRIDGPATDPVVSFTSSPDLPEEEILSRLLFGRDLTTLSPLQAAQLANAVASLSGRGGQGVVARLRQGFGLDDLDLRTDDTGGAAVTAGKYLSENVYTEVVVGSEGKTEINLNLDVSDSVTLRGRAGNDGSTGVGVFFEKDY